MEIRGAVFKDSRLSPSLHIQCRNRTVKFRTPFDWYKDEMDYDRQNLSKAAGLLQQLSNET
jgi:hypothetical protein